MIYIARTWSVFEYGGLFSHLLVYEGGPAQLRRAFSVFFNWLQDSLDELFRIPILLSHGDDLLDTPLAARAMEHSLVSMV